MKVDDRKGIKRTLPDGREYIEYPAKELFTPPTNQVIALLLSIPKGRITCTDDIQDYFKGMYGVEMVQLDYRCLYAWAKGDPTMPYWRVVSVRGHVYDGNISQIEKLTEDGITVEYRATKSQSWIVKDYKELMYPLQNIPYEMIINTEIPNKSYCDIQKEGIVKEGLYKTLSTDTLISMVNGTYNADYVVYQNDAFKEMCKKELSDRGVDISSLSQQ